MNWRIDLAAPIKDPKHVRIIERKISPSNKQAINRWLRRNPKEERLSVYLAGKIARDDWRNQFTWNRAGTESFHDSRLLQSNFKNHDHLRLVGPFFTSCDHGCSHSLDHALYADQTGGHDAIFDCSQTSSNRDLITTRCIEWMEQADIVIAVIDDDAHGTIFEVGYASAKGIPVVAVEGENLKEAWFPLHAPGVETASGESVEAVINDLDMSVARAMQINKCESPIERAFFQASLQLDLLTTFDVNVPVLGGKYRIDLADTGRKIAIELDGHAYHSSKERFESDRVRQRELEVLGWRFIRFAGAEVNRDPQKCVIEAEKLVRSMTA